MKKKSRWLAVSLSIVACGIACGPSEQKKAEEKLEESSPFEPQDLVEITQKLKQAVEAKSANPTEHPVGIVGSATSSYWNAIQVGSTRATADIGAPLLFQASTDPGQPAQQVQILNSAYSQGFKQLAIAPINDTTVTDAIKSGISSGVAFVTIDTDSQAFARSFYLGTDNYGAGFNAGKQLAKLLGTSGNVHIVTTFANPLPFNASERVRGIQEGLVGTQIQIAGTLITTKDKCAADVEALLDSTANIDALVTINATPGPLTAASVVKKGKNGTMKLVSWDATAENQQYLTQGVTNALIGQRPYWMGYLGAYLLYANDTLGTDELKTLLAPWLKGNQDFLDTGTDVLTPDNLDQYIAYLAELGIQSN